MATPIVAIVGRPNIGKSTLFNRIIGKRMAIVDSYSGVTRDRNYSLADWGGKEFMLVDTGGYLLDYKDDIDLGIREQVEEAIAEADLILFMGDVQSGITKNEQVIGKMLLKSGKPVLAVVNKTDSKKIEPEVGAFMRLGFGEPLGISAQHGRGVADLLDTLVEVLPDTSTMQTDDDSINIAIVGRPNVGKSSIVNSLIGKERMLVTNIPGTTRDSIDTHIKRDGQKFCLIDTAGLQRKNKGYHNVDYYSSLRSIRALDRCHLAVVVVDATEGLSRQDFRIIEMAAEAQRGILLVLNKWDLTDKNDKAFDTMLEEVRFQLKNNSFIQIVSTSALTKQRVFKVLDLCKKVYVEWNRRIETGPLNKMLEEAIETNHPPSDKGKLVTIKYATQVQSAPPEFAFFTNRPTGVTEAYRRYLMKQIREKFGFQGIPIKIVMKKKSSRD